MSNIPAHLLAAAQAAVEAGTEVDMTQATKGGGSRLLPEGYAFGRIVEYVELGNHVVQFEGKDKDPAPQFYLGFALYGEGYQNEDGSPYLLRTYEISQSTNEKAKAFKLFKKLNWKNTHKTFGTMLSEGFLVKIVTHTSKAANSKPRSIIDLEGFLPPIDVVSKQPYAIPEPNGDMYKLFLWNHPSMPMWDSLFVEGKYDDGKSKNWLQEKICSATNFPGSPLEILLHGAGMPSLAAPATPAVPAAPAEVPQTPSSEPVNVPWDESNATAQPAAVPATPNVPNVPAVPAGVPAVPTGVPGVPTGAPAVPNIPGVPNLPKL